MRNISSTSQAKPGDPPDRARGYTWSTVAERYGITTRRAQQIVREEIETLDQVIEYIADHAARTVNEAIWLGATELKLKVREPGSQ